MEKRPTENEIAYLVKVAAREGIEHALREAYKDGRQIGRREWVESHWHDTVLGPTGEGRLTGEGQEHEHELPAEFDGLVPKEMDAGMLARAEGNSDGDQNRNEEEEPRADGSEAGSDR